MTARFRDVATKIVEDRAELARRLESLRAAGAGGGPGEGTRIVFTNGCFDLLHPGHVAYLTEARAFGTHLVVALNTDESVSALKGPLRPILPLRERLKVIASLGCVDFATSFAEPDPRPLILALRPDVLVKGGDYTVDQVLGREEVWSWGGEVRIVPMLPGYSTTSYVARMKAARTP